MVTEEGLGAICDEIKSEWLRSSGMEYHDENSFGFFAIFDMRCM
jgi:hypothetical protein